MPLQRTDFPAQLYLVLLFMMLEGLRAIFLFYYRHNVAKNWGGPHVIACLWDFQWAEDDDLDAEDYSDDGLDAFEYGTCLSSRPFKM